MEPSWPGRSRARRRNPDELNESDYNAIESTLGPPLRWRPLIASSGVLMVAGLACIPFDAPLADAAQRAGKSLGGDLERTLKFIEQFGDGASTIIVALGVLLCAGAALRVRLVLWLSGAITTAALVHVLKIAIGRPRPRFHDPHTFAWFFRTYPVQHQGEEVARYSWQTWIGSSSDLASMPSSHTSAAFAMAVGLCVVFPGGRWLWLSLAAIVALARVLHGAHYVSDVLVAGSVGLLGASIGIALSRRVLLKRMGR